MMLLEVETDIMVTNNEAEPPTTSPETFILEIDANASNEMVQKHLMANYEALQEEAEGITEDESLQTKWKGRKIERAEGR